MNTIRIKQFEKAYRQGKSKVTTTFGEHTQVICFGSVKAGFGERHYFICSDCSKYRDILAYNGEKFTCFKCARINPYAGIQTTTRGGDVFISYKMARYAKRHGVKDFRIPFKYHEYERPPRYKYEKWDKTMRVLQALESMRNQSIFFEKIWNVKTIRSVERGEDEALQLGVFYHLTYFHPFGGESVDTDTLWDRIRADFN